MQTGQTFDRGPASRPRGPLARIAGLDDRTTSRWIKRLAIIFLVITVPTVALYVSDQYRAPAPSLMDQAIATAEDAVRQNPNTLSVRFALAQVYEQAGRLDEALVQYDQILSVEPTAKTAQVARGNVHLTQGDVEGARADFQAVVDANKDSDTAVADKHLEAAYYGLATIAMKAGDGQAALANAEAAARIGRTDADALNLLGQAYAMTGDQASAVKLFTRAAAFVPTGWCDPYQGLAAAYTQLADAAGIGYATGMVAFCEKRYEDARPLLTAQVAGAYGLEALIGLGEMAEEQGDPATAAGFYAQAYAQDSSNFHAIAGLNRLGADEKGNLPSTPAEGQQP